MARQVNPQATKEPVPTPQQTQAPAPTPPAPPVRFVDYASI